MDRGKSFRILGLPETASKAQVKAAYERKLAKYKGPDYMEEPAYAERKIAQLYQVYQEAYELAGNNSEAAPPLQFERETAKAPKKKAGKGSRLSEEERNARDYDVHEKHRKWRKRRDEEKYRGKIGKGMTIPTLEKPTLSKLKKKLSEIKEEVATQLELSTGDTDTMREYVTVERADSNEDSFADFSEEPTYIDSLQRPEDGGRITRETSVTDTGRDNTKINTPFDSEAKGGELLGTIVSIGVALIMFFVGACQDDSSNVDFEEPAYSYIYDLEYADIADADLDLAAMAYESWTILNEQYGNESGMIEDEEESEYEKQAAQFAKNYWKMNSIEEVSNYLCDTYSEYTTSPDEALAKQLDAIFSFYGFISLEEAVWYIQPYTDEPIYSYGDYLTYLNQFYETQ